MPTMPTWLLATQRWARALISGQWAGPDSLSALYTLISTSPYFIVDYGRAEAQLQTLTWTVWTRTAARDLM